MHIRNEARLTQSREADAGDDEILNARTSITSTAGGLNRFAVSNLMLNQPIT